MSSDVHVETTPVGPLLRPARPTDVVILFMQSDWLLAERSATFSRTAVRLARETPAAVVCCGYPLYFPDALDTVHAGLDYCEGLGQVAVAGEQMGAGLAAALLLSLRDREAKAPCCAVLSAALFDLTLDAPSLSLNAAANPAFDIDGLRRRVTRYAAGATLTDPLLSPLHGNLHGLPPIQLLAVGNDPLLDDSLAFAARAARSGVAVDLRVRPVGTEPDLGTIAAMAAFIRAHTGAEPSRTDSTSRKISG